MKNNQILFSIVCFREVFRETLAFNSLQSSFVNFNETCKEFIDFKNSSLNIFIYDNTDIDGWEVFNNEKYDDLNIVYKQDKNNPGISVAYNNIVKYASDNNYEYVVFLDQDTILPINCYEVYLKCSFENNFNIGAPTIKTQNIIFSPSIYKNFRTKNFTNLVQKDLYSKEITCINSGLMVKTVFFLKVGGYSEQLRLDFCDHEFIKRALKYVDYIFLLPICLHQSFSTDENSLEKALFRYQFFVKDLKRFKKLNNNNFLISLNVDLLHLLRLSFQYFTFKFFIIRFFQK